MSSADTTTTRARDAYMTEGHEIFDRVTRLEANLKSLADSVTSLTVAVRSTDHGVSELRSMMTSVGKTDGKTILTLGASMLGALGIIGSMFLGPIQRDVAHLNTSLLDARTATEREILRHDDLLRRVEANIGTLVLFEWRLKNLEAK